MGYQHKAPRIEVRFAEGHDYHGLEVSLRKLTLGEYLDITGIGEVTGITIADQLRAMGDKLLSWNLEDEEGRPVPATSEAVLNQDMDLMIAVSTAWLDAINGVPAPLEQSSTGGEPSLEGSIPMDVLSKSLAS